MSRIDVTDKVPFANADAEPRDNVSTIGFLTRLVLRFGFFRLIYFIIGLIISLFIAKYMGVDSLLIMARS